MNALDVLVLLAYVSLVVELVVFPIPSEASTLQLLAARRTNCRDALGIARRRPLWQKALRYFVPTAIGVVLFVLPLVAVLVPSVRQSLGFFAAAPRAIAAIGAALVVAGRLTTFTSVLQLRRARRTQQQPGGWFVVSRNPGLLGMYAFYVGLCCVYPNPWLWLGAQLYVANMHQRVRMEEAHQAARQGASWRRYAARVPRYLPLPGLR
jgi:protein-S-isoprenylcysteine O-methyltransferase Ste14